MLADILSAYLTQLSNEQVINGSLTYELPSSTSSFDCRPFFKVLTHDSGTVVPLNSCLINGRSFTATLDSASAASITVGQYDQYCSWLREAIKTESSDVILDTVLRYMTMVYWCAI